MKVRLEILRIASKAVTGDLRRWDISQRRASKQLGIANSTLNAFLNCEYNTQHRATLEKILAGAIWSPFTREQLQTLLDYEALAFSGDLNCHVRHDEPGRPALRVLDGGRAK